MRSLAIAGAMALALGTVSGASAQQPSTPTPGQNPPAAGQPSPQGQPGQPGQGQPGQATPSSQPPAAQAKAAPQRLFNGDAGLILNFIKPDKTADFELVMARLKDALMKSDKPERKQQAAGWKVFKAAESGPNGSVIYVFMMDPATKGVDYTVPMILNEASPTEAQELYKKYAESFASGQNIVNLSVIAAMGQP